MMFALFLYMCVPENVLELRPPLTYAEEAAAGPNPFYRLLKYALLIAGFGVIIWRSALARQVISKVNVFLLAFVALVGLSITWSITPSATVLRLAAIMTICIVSWSFVLTNWHPKRLEQVIRPTLTLFLLVSLIVGPLLPDITKEVGDTVSLENAWRGIFTSKNTFGQAASVAVILWVHAWLTDEVKIWRFLAGAGISVACVLLSRSSTALLATVLVAPLQVVLLREKIRTSRVAPYLIAVLLGIMVLYSMVVLNIIPGVDVLLGALTESFGKDTTFSGRAILWEYLRQHIALHPILGTGYGAYWIGPVPTSPSYIFVVLGLGYPPEGHNGYLDLINDLGFVGFGCLVGYVWVYFQQSIMLRKREPLALLGIALLFQQLIENSTQSMWLQSSSIPFVVMTTMSFGMARILVDQKYQAAAVAPRSPVRGKGTSRIMSGQAER